ncbi:MAG: TVP38/TMEM64 family protein [Methyloligellaceae bacterium]
MKQETNAAERPENNNTMWLKRILPLSVLVLVAGVVYQQGWFKYITIEQLALNREFLLNYISTNFVLALLIYMGIYTLAVSVSFPGASFLTLAGGLLFGWVAGGIATIFAATIGATIVFLVAKLLLSDFFAAKAGPLVDKMRKGFNEDAFNYMLFLRLVPVFPFWLVNIAPGILGVRLSTFFAGTILGIIPGTFAFIYIGVGLDSIINAQLGPYQSCLASGKGNCSFEFSTSGLVTKELIIAFVLLGVVSVIPVVLKKLRKAN